jgi:hypothetical protein
MRVCIAHPDETTKGIASESIPIAVLVNTGESSIGSDNEENLFNDRRTEYAVGAAKLVF